ncbi:MAG: hypothetical protein RLZZ58_1151 [Pseudomonadota bacterium]
MMRRVTALLLTGGMVVALAGCGDRADQAANTPRSAPKIERTETVPDEQGGIDGATPMAARKAVVSLLNKRNGLVRDLDMVPGQSARVGRAIVRLRACERTAPWESPQETGAFVQLLVQEQRDDKWYRVFSGWLFKDRPERNIVQHPIYDVFVKSCTMSFPGGDPLPSEKPAPATKSSSAPQSASANGGDGGANAPAAASAPAPSAEPSTE